jgi:hypothetical protein
MNGSRGLFTLYYSVRSPLSSEETPQEEQFGDIAAALLRAYLISQQGGNPTGVVHDNAWLFSGDDLKYVLKNVSDNGNQSGEALAEAVRETLPEVLIKQLAKTVKFAHEHFGAVAVYRDLLEELYNAADQAIQKKDLELLHKITGKLAFWYVPGESDVKQWGKDFLHAYRRDAGWLSDAKRALEKIRGAAKQLELEDPRNTELKAQIIKAADEGLITHV